VKNKINTAEFRVPTRRTAKRTEDKKTYPHFWIQFDEASYEAYVKLIKKFNLAEVKDGRVVYPAKEQSDVNRDFILMCAEAVDRLDKLIAAVEKAQQE